MSSTGDEDDRPGADYPDRQDADGATETPADDGHHRGHDGGRDTLTVDQAQHSAGGLGERGEQTRPAMSENNASADEKLGGLIEQMRADMTGDERHDIEHVLRQRAEQSGLDLSSVDVDELVTRIRG